MTKRVKTVLSPADVGRVLGLPDTLRVVGMYVRPDPDALAVLIEGDDLPETFMWSDGPSDQRMAAAGAVEAPVVPHDTWRSGPISTGG